MAAAAGSIFLRILPALASFGPQLKDGVGGAIKTLNGPIGQLGQLLFGVFHTGGRQGRAEMNSLGVAGEQAADRISGAFKNIGAVVGLGILSNQITDFVKDSVLSASDLQESINAINVTIGKEGAASWEAFSTAASSNLALTQGDLNQLVTPLAALLGNSGSAGNDLVGQLEAISSRATDLSSVFNKDVSTAITSFGGILRGEYDTAEQFGIKITEQDVNLKALSLGYAKNKDSVSSAAKAQAALAIAFEQTDRFAGDFDKTQGSLANSLRTLQASFNDITTAVGKAILPVAEKLVTTFQAILPQLLPVMEQFGSAIALALDGLLPLMQPILDIVRLLVYHATALIPPFAQFLSTVLTPLLSIGGKFLGLFLPVTEMLAELAGTVLTALEPAFAALSSTMDVLIPLFAGAFKEAIEFLTPILVDLATQFSALAVEWGPVLIGMFREMAPVIMNLMRELVPMAQEILVHLMGAFRELAPMLGELYDAFMEMHIAIWTVGKALWPLLPPLIDLFALLATIGIPMMIGFAKITTAVINAVVAAFNAMSVGTAAALNAIVTAWEWAGNQVVKIYNNTIARLPDVHIPGTDISFGGKLDEINLGRVSAPKIEPIKPYEMPKLPELGEMGKYKLPKIDPSKVPKDTSGDDADKKRAADKAQKEREAKASKALDKQVSQLEEVRNKLKEVQDAAKDFAKSVRDSFLDMGKITESPKGPRQTFVGIRNNLRAAIDQAKRFATTIKQLAGLGLNKASLQELIEAGPEAGYDSARALLTGGKSGIGEINKDRKILDDLGKDFGKKASAEIFGSDIRDAMKDVTKELHDVTKVFNDLVKKFGKAFAKDALGDTSLAKPKAGAAGDKDNSLKNTKTAKKAIADANAKVVNNKTTVTFGAGSVVVSGVTGKQAEKSGILAGQAIADILRRQMMVSALNGNG